MSNDPTVEHLKRLRDAARRNPAADAAYVEAFQRAPQHVREQLLSGRRKGAGA